MSPTPGRVAGGRRRGRAAPAGRRARRTRRWRPASAWCTSISRWPPTSRSSTTSCWAPSPCGAGGATGVPPGASSTALIADAGLDVPLDAMVGGLSIGERQRVEILKALYRDVRVLILDEPTAVLTPQEAEGLFATLHRAGRGGARDPVHQPQARRGDAPVPARRRAARRAQGGRVPGQGHQPRRDRRGHGRPPGQPAAARRAAARRPRPGAARCRPARPRRDGRGGRRASPSTRTRSSASPASRATASGRWPACSRVWPGPRQARCAWRAAHGRLAVPRRGGRGRSRANTGGPPGRGRGRRAADRPEPGARDLPPPRHTSGWASCAAAG